MYRSPLGPSVPSLALSRSGYQGIFSGLSFLVLARKLGTIPAYLNHPFEEHCTL